MSSFFPYLTLQRRYLCFIHTLSTCIPHKIHIKSQSYPHSCPISFQKKKADSVSISVQCCTPTFRKSYFYLPVYPFSEQFFSSVIYGFDYNILFSSSQGFLLDHIRHLMQNGTMPARKVSHKRTDRYSRLPETVPMVFPRLLRQTVWASAQGSAEKEAAKNTVPERPGYYHSHRLSTVHITLQRSAQIPGD